jgi:conjugative transposon protein TcpC
MKPVSQKRKSSRRQGGGRSVKSSSARYGRLRARLPRFAFLAFIAVMSLAGIRSILVPTHPASVVRGNGGEIDYAEQSFAIAFARAYLTFDSSRPEAHEAALAPFVSSALESNGGFNPPRVGSQRVDWADVAQVQHPLAGGEIVTVAATLNTARAPVYLSVPVRRVSDKAIALAGYPSFVGPPLSSSPDPDEGDREAVSDGEVTRLVKRALANYLAGNAEDLAADLAQAATVTLPSNPLRLRGVEELVWVKGSGGGATLATVSAADGRGGTYTLRYEVGLHRVEASDPQIGPGWRITYIQTISQES